MVAGGPGAGILERTRIGRDGGEQAIGDGPGDGPVRRLEQTEDQLAGGGFPGGHPVDVAVACVAGMMIDIDEPFAVLHAFADLPHPFEAGRIRGEDAVESMAGRRRSDEFAGIEEGEFLGKRILVPADDLFALGLQSQSEGELRPDAIAVGADVAGDTQGPAGADGFEDAVNDPGMVLHEGDRERSISSMISSTRLPRATESSRTKRRRGVYLSTTARPTRPWMRRRSFLRRSIALRCCSGVPMMPTNTVADWRSPATPTSLTVIRPASPAGISRRITSPISRLRSSRTRWCRRDCILPGGATSVYRFAPGGTRMPWRATRNIPRRRRGAGAGPCPRAADLSRSARPARRRFVEVVLVVARLAAGVASAAVTVSGAPFPGCNIRSHRRPGNR